MTAARRAGERDARHHGRPPLMRVAAAGHPDETSHRPSRDPVQQMSEIKLAERLREASRRSCNVREVLTALPTDECVNWPGTLDRQGYGVIASKVSHLAHRYVYILFHGVPALPELDHRCRNRACVNPAHLEPVTHAENNRRKVEATTHCPNRHPYTPENTYVSPRGWRYCRTCRRAADRRRPSGGARLANSRRAA